MAALEPRDRHLPVHRSRGFDAPVGGASRRDARRAGPSRRPVVRDAVEGHGGQVVKSTGDGRSRRSAPPHDGVSAAASPRRRALCASEWPDGARAAGPDGPARGRGDRAGRRLVRLRCEPGGAGDGGRARRADPVHRRGRRAGARAVRAASISASTGCATCSPTVHLFQVDVPGPPGVVPAVAVARRVPLEPAVRAEQLRRPRGRAALDRGPDAVDAGGVDRRCGRGGQDPPGAAGRLGAACRTIPDGVWLCELAQVLDPDDLPDAVAAAVGYAPPQGVSVAEGLPRFLERKDLLLVLDNCEHLVGAVAAFVTATTAARGAGVGAGHEPGGARGAGRAHLAVGVARGAGRRRCGRRCWRRRRARCSSPAPAKRAASWCSTTRTRRRCTTCACVSTGSRWRSSWPPAQTKMMTPGEILTRLDKQFRLLDRRAAHQPGTAPDPARRDRLVLRPAQRRRTGAARPAVGVRGRLRPRRRGRDRGRDRRRRVRGVRAARVAGREVAGGAQRARRRHALPAAGDDPPVRRRAAQRDRRGGSRPRRPRPPLPRAGDRRSSRGASTAADYEALERLDTETANIAAAGRWLLADDRVAELVQFFDDLPFVDPFALPVTTLDELGGIAAEAVERSEASKRCRASRRHAGSPSPAHSSRGTSPPTARSESSRFVRPRASHSG